MRRKKVRVDVGSRHGRLVVKSLYVTILKGIRRTMAVVVCDCGKEKTVRADGLSRSTNSCGCLVGESRTKVCKKRNTTLLATQGRFSVRFPKEYRCWRSILNRCYNAKQRSYAAYGAKGVVVCEYLKAKPHNLMEFLGKMPSPKHGVDRHPIHNGNYTCGSCPQCEQEGWAKNVRWATRKQQSNNRGDFNVRLTAFGRTMTMGEWSDLTGLDQERIRLRLRGGWSHEKTVSTPDKRGNCYKA